jgi:hypothetical protein
VEGIREDTEPLLALPRISVRVRQSSAFPLQPFVTHSGQSASVQSHGMFALLIAIPVASLESS